MHLNMVAHCPAHFNREGIVEEVIQTVLSTVDMQVILSRTARLLRRHFGATRVTIVRLLEDAPEQGEVLLVDDPKYPSTEVGSRFALSESVCGEAVRERRPILVAPMNPQKPRFREEALLGAYGYGALVCFPLVFEETVLGTLYIAHPPKDHVLDCCVHTAGQVARLVAIAFHNSLMVEQVRKLNQLLDQENALLREEIRQVRKDRRYIAQSQLMQEVVDKARLVAPTDMTVLIRGETGTGKEGLARMLHDFSPRAHKPWVVANLGAIPESLIESDLFGHEKGAFTGATSRRAGRFEQAEGGTLFLDEIGDAPPPVQVRLLRVLQEREVQRVGGGAPIPVNVRVVAATHRNLEAMVAEGSFRSDLYYRLNIFPLLIPPLRERPEDIRPLTSWFLEHHARLMNRLPPKVPEAVWRQLEGCAWPGNVRELENFIQRALILSPGEELRLPEAAAAIESSPSSAPQSRPRAVRSFDEEMREVLGRALEQSQGHIYGPAGAAALLGIPPTTLQGKLRRFGLLGTKRDN